MFIATGRWHIGQYRDERGVGVSGGKGVGNVLRCT